MQCFFLRLGQVLPCSPPLLQARGGWRSCWQRPSLETRSAHDSQAPPSAPSEANCRKPVVRRTFPQYPVSTTSGQKGSLEANTNRARHIFPGNLTAGSVSQPGCCPHIHACEPNPGVGFQIFFKVMTSLFLNRDLEWGWSWEWEQEKPLWWHPPVPYSCWAKREKNNILEHEKMPKEGSLEEKKLEWVLMRQDWEF